MIHKLFSGTRTSTGNGSIFNLGSLRNNVVAQLEVTAADGTLDVLVQESLDGENWYTLLTFTQAAATTNEIKKSSAVSLPLLRVNYTIAGATPSFTFNVVAVSN